MKATLARLMRHAWWANRRTLASLEAIGEPPAAAVARIAHVVTTERIYLSRVRNEDPFPQDFWPRLSVTEAIRVADLTGPALTTFVEAATEERLARPARYRNSRGAYYETPIGEMLEHVALHGEHHRGQIAFILRAASFEPAVTDLITFVREEAGDPAS